ncbi:MAG TPA: hypothetical protein VGP82_06645 [Ktedonobacterales bacterium]|nr:hypothetical protein [Ktedonobacterales bacterium]
MHHEYFGYEPPYGGSPAHQFLMSGISTMLWLAFIGLVVWGATMYFHRTRAQRQLATQEAPSAIELLRRRYVIGQIDLVSFEEMVYHVLESEQRERLHRLELL